MGQYATCNARCMFHVGESGGGREREREENVPKRETTDPEMPRDVKCSAFGAFLNLVLAPATPAVPMESSPGHCNAGTKAYIANVCKSHAESRILVCRQNLVPVALL